MVVMSHTGILACEPDGIDPRNGERPPKRAPRRIVLITEPHRLAPEGYG
jgi:hypothetical protein